jgi:hypothetical protein
MRRGSGALIAALVAIVAAACDEERAPVPCPLGCPDAAPRCDSVYEPPPAPGDVDGDGIANDEDPDADGDGVDNEFEHTGGFGCAGPDDDGDGLANWLDRDSDNDGLLDGTEYENGSSPYDPDTDDDGASDLIEAAAQTAPGDDASSPRPSDSVLIADLGAAAQVITVRIPNRIENADVFFLVDTTGSMGEERDNLITGISEVIAPMLVEAFDDVAFGAAGFDDYPVEGFGAGSDVPFYLLTTMIEGLVDTQHTSASGGCSSSIGRLLDGPNDVPDIEDALQGLACHNGNDLPEAALPALHATATGDSLVWSDGMVDPQDGCLPGEVGYPCFRSEALPIIVLVGDAPFHNGPGDSVPYSFEAPTYDETIAALNLIGAKVVSVYSGPAGADLDYLALARDTDTTNAAGIELVYAIDGDGSGIDNTIVEGIRTLAEGITQDVTLSIVDADEDPSDSTSLVTAWRAVEGYSPTGTAGANPGVSYASKDETTFFMVAPNAEVEFELTLENTTISPMEEATVAIVKVNVVGQAGKVFASRRYFVVVAEDSASIVGL